MFFNHLITSLIGKSEKQIKLRLVPVTVSNSYAANKQSTRNGDLNINLLNAKKMSSQSIVNSKSDQKFKIKKRRSKYIIEKYHERSITNRLFK